jgi:hypothetical protein
MTPIIPLTFSRPPSHLTCTPPSDPSALLPTVILAITFTSTQERLLAPVHGLNWALKSPQLASLSRSKTPTEEMVLRGGEIVLPVVELNLPSKKAFSVLHDWVYLSSTTRLFESLMKEGELSQERGDSQEGVIERLELVQGLWQNVMALGVADDELWKTMERAWDALMVKREQG